MRFVQWDTCGLMPASVAFAVRGTIGPIGSDNPVLKLLWLKVNDWSLTVTSLWQHASETTFRDASWIFAHYDPWMSVAEKSATQKRSSAKARHIQNHLDENSLSSCSSHSPPPTRLLWGFLVWAKVVKDWGIHMWKPKLDFLRSPLLYQPGRM